MGASTWRGNGRAPASIVVGLIALIGLSGCTTSVSDENPYAEEISQAYESAESDYVRDILSDGQITAAEVRDAQQHNVACLSEAGISAEYVDSGAGYEVLQTGDLRDDKLDAEYVCYKKWVGEVYSIYIGQITNPENGDFEALIAKCLVAKGLVHEGFSGADYRELLAQSSVRVSSTEEGSVTLPPTEEVFLPGGESLRNPQAAMCESNPSL